jgi:hypothetical protein
MERIVGEVEGSDAGEGRLDGNCSKNWLICVVKVNG